MIRRIWTKQGKTLKYVCVIWEFQINLTPSLLCDSPKLSPQSEPVKLWNPSRPWLFDSPRQATRSLISTTFFFLAVPQWRCILVEGSMEPYETKSIRRISTSVSTDRTSKWRFVMASTWCNLMDDRHIGFVCVNFTLIHILSPEMNSLAQKIVYIMYYTRVLNKNCQNQNFLILRGGRDLWRPRKLP